MGHAGTSAAHSMSGATREEILTVLKMAALLGLHSCSLGAPILLEEAKAVGVEPGPKDKVSTPVCDKAREIGQWNTAWDPFFNLDPLWTEQFIGTGLPIYTGALIPPKLAELLSIALDAPYTQLITPKEDSIQGLSLSSSTGAARALNSWSGPTTFGNNGFNTGG